MFLYMLCVLVVTLQICTSYDKIQPCNTELLPTTYIALGNGTTSVASTIGLCMYTCLHLTETQAQLKDISYNVHVIDVKINKNYANAFNFKEVVTAVDPIADDVIHVDEEGFQCDEEYCSLVNIGLHSFGICSRFICECGKVNPRAYQCADIHKVYDPVFTICDYPQNVKLCGVHTTI